MTLAELPIAIDADEIARFCRERGIRRLAAFGSALRDDFTPASDVGLLDFDSARKVSALPATAPSLHCGHGNHAH